MSGALALLPEVIISPAGPGTFLVGNPFTRTWAVADTAFVELLSSLAGATSGERAGGGPYRARDATRSPVADGLLGDPTGLDRGAGLDGAEELDATAALKLAERLCFVTADEAAYEESLQPRQNVFDRSHRGNLHQLAGDHVLLDLRRADLDVWWADQKFSEDRRGPQPGPYLDVQWRFIDAYYDAQRLEGRSVLDFGCGPGLFARLFASRGANVVGMDISDEHLDTARRLAAEDGLQEQTEFLTLDLPVERGLAALGDRRFDLAFLSDVMMFYFHPYGTDAELSPVALLSELRELLAPGGRIAVLEPNGTFWQQPWLGSPSRPFTVLTEYRRRRYGVTPTLEQLSRAAEEAGLAIARVRELTPAPTAGERTRDAGFASEFPLWWFFELVPA